MSARRGIFRIATIMLLAPVVFACAAPVGDRKRAPLMVDGDPTAALIASAAGAENGWGTTMHVAQAAPTDEQRRRTEYVQRALRPAANPAIAGRTERATGTAFFVSDHFLLTNYHVVAKCAVLTIEAGEAGEALTVTVETVDQLHDLAALKSDVPSKDSALLEPMLDHADGSDLSVVGYPAHGLALRLPSITPAVASPGALLSEAELFRFAADVHPGQSGSPLLDEYGAVVGVVAKRVDSVTTYQKSGKLVTNLGFAIPNRVVMAFLQAHHVPYHLALPSRSLPPAERLEIARRFVFRIGCWQ